MSATTLPDATKHLLFGVSKLFALNTLPAIKYTIARLLMYLLRVSPVSQQEY